MANSKVVKERISGPECVICGWTEYDVREITAVGPDQDDSAIGDRYQKCRNCGDTYDE